MPKPPLKPFDESRGRLLAAILATGRDLKSVSLEIGRNHAYLQQYVVRGVPSELSASNREQLIEMLGRDWDQRPTRTANGGKARMMVGSISEMNVRASAGGGQIIDYEDTNGSWSFPREWLRHELRAAPPDLRIITIDGDSMMSDPQKASDLDPGDKVIVNVADLRPTPPGVFILHDGVGLVAKRIEVIAGSDPATLRIMSNNDRYQTYERTVDEVKIVGRVVFRFQRVS